MYGFGDNESGLEKLQGALAQSHKAQNQAQSCNTAKKQRKTQSLIDYENRIALSESSDDGFGDAKKVITKEEKLRKYHRKVQSKIDQMLSQQDRAEKFISKSKSIENKYKVTISDKELVESYFRRQKAAQMKKIDCEIKLIEPMV